MEKEQLYIIDAHCHVYPEKILPAAVDATGHFYGEKPYHDGTVRQLMEDGQACGIRQFVIQSVATSPRQVHSINEFIAREVANRPDVLVGLGTAHPRSEDPAGDIRHLMELGLKGVKIHPDIQGFPADDPGYQAIYALCAREGLPLLMHTGDYRYDYSNPNRVLPMLRAYPGLTVIGAHLGGWSQWEQASEAMCDQPNLYVDCSSSLGYLSAETAGKIIRRYGAQRVLFGTDYPLHSLAEEVRLFFQIDLSDEERRLILSENARKIYGIPAP